MAGDEGDAPDDGSGVVTDQAPGREGAGRTFDGVDTGSGAERHTTAAAAPVNTFLNRYLFWWTGLVWITVMLAPATGLSPLTLLTPEVRGQTMGSGPTSLNSSA